VVFITDFNKCFSKTVCDKTDLSVGPSASHQATYPSPCSDIPYNEYNLLALLLAVQ
jgi:hypothetical protein